MKLSLPKSCRRVVPIEALESRIAPATFSVSDASVIEGNTQVLTQMRFEVRLSEAMTTPVTVHVETANGTALAGTSANQGDYYSLSGDITFAAGTTVLTVGVPVWGDTLAEPNEHFFLRLSNPVGATLAKAEGVGTITSDDSGTVPPGQVGVGIVNAATAEGHSGQKDLLFNVTLSGASTNAVTLHYATELRATDTANAEDFVAAQGDLTFAPGELVKQIAVKINGDTTVEANETFAIRLSNVVGAVSGNLLATGIISNDDTSNALPSLLITSAPPAPEGNSGLRDALFTVRLSQASTTAVSVRYQTNFGSATATDIVPVAGELIFNPGQIEQIIRVPVIGDTQVESDETFAVQLLNPIGAVIGSNTFATAKILNDDTIVQPPVGPMLSVVNPSLFTAEGNDGVRELIVRLNLSAASTSEVRVNFATEDYSATAISGDYEQATGTVVFAPGTTQQQVVLRVKGDTLFETDEHFRINFSGLTGAEWVGVNWAQIGINNDDVAPPPQARFNFTTQNLSKHEGNDGLTEYTFTVARDTVLTGEVSVGYETVLLMTPAVVGGPVAANADDFIATSGRLIFADGETVKTFTVQVKGDADIEANEIFGVRLLDPTGGALGNASASHGTIINDDGIPVLINAQGGSVIEGHTGTRDLTFHIHLNGPSALPITVHYATADSPANPATAGTDYEAIAGDLTFAPGELSKRIVVKIKGDTHFELNEQFRLLLSDPVGAQIATTSAPIGVIINDDTFNPGPGTPLRISADRRVANWSDVDGELVTLYSSKPILDVSDFDLVATGNGYFLNALLLSDDAEARGTDLAIHVSNLPLPPNTTTATPHAGTVNIGTIDATGLDLGHVYISGTMHTMTVGDAELISPAIKRLQVHGITGLLNVDGHLNTLHVRGHLNGQVHVTGNLGTLSVAGTTDGLVQIGGGLRMASLGALDGASLHVNGILGILRIMDRVHDTDISSNTALGSIHIGGDLTASRITAIGTDGMLAIRHLTAASVAHTSILAGYDHLGNHVRADASIGEIRIRGDWTASDLVAGSIAGTDGLFGTTDDTYPDGTTTAGRIARIIIQGEIHGAPGTHHNGIVASAIHRAKINGAEIPLDPTAPDNLQLASNLYLREIRLN